MLNRETSKAIFLVQQLTRLSGIQDWLSRITNPLADKAVYVNVFQLCITGMLLWPEFQQCLAESPTISLFISFVQRFPFFPSLSLKWASLLSLPRNTTSVIPQAPIYAPCYKSLHGVRTPEFQHGHQLTLAALCSVIEQVLERSDTR